MGSFSFTYCDMGTVETQQNDCGLQVLPKKEQRLIYWHPASVLFPEEFGGKAAQIDVEHYEDYGRFAGNDIYELVADWNRKWISEHPEWIRPYDKQYGMKHPEYPGEPISKKPWYPYFADLSLSREEVIEKWRKSMKEPEVNGPCWLEYRWIGIEIACQDEDNLALPYPIKIARHKESIYEECPASFGDPYQGGV